MPPPSKFSGRSVTERCEADPKWAANEIMNLRRQLKNAERESVALAAVIEACEGYFKACGKTWEPLA